MRWPKYWSCFRCVQTKILILIHSPKLGYTEIHYDDYKMCRVKSFSYGEEGLLIDLEPLPDFVLNNTEAPDYRWEE